MPLIPAPIAKRRMPSALIASAAVFGGIFPALFSPSVSRTIARLFDFLSVQPVRRRRHRRTDRRPVLDQADPHPLEILQEPIMIEGQRTNDIGPAGKGDDPDPIVRPGFR